MRADSQRITKPPLEEKMRRLNRAEAEAFEAYYQMHGDHGKDLMDNYLDFRKWRRNWQRSQQAAPKITIPELCS